MKIALKKNNADWILANFIRTMTFDDIIEVSAARLKMAKGAYCVYVDHDLVVRVIKLAVDTCDNINQNFFELCSKIHNVSKLPQKQYGILFDIRNEKIRAIKAYREILRNNTVIDIMGRSYDSGLGTVKQTVEAGVVLGPFSKNDVYIVEAILRAMNTGAEFDVVEITGNMETLAKDHKRYIWNR